MNDYFKVPDVAVLNRQRLTELVGDLQTLGLLGAKDFDKAQGLLDRADEAEAAARSYGDYVNTFIREEGEELALRFGDGTVDAGVVRSRASNIADRSHVLRICEATWVAAIREAGKLVYAKSDQYRDVLNVELTALSEKAAELAGGLAGITTAEAAISAGKVEEWTAAGELVATYGWLRGVVGRLREASKLDKPRNGEGGFWWDFRTAPFLERGGFRKALDSADRDGGRAKFFQEMAAGPWVPTREEALEAVKVHDDAQIAYQTGGRA